MGLEFLTSVAGITSKGLVQEVPVLRAQNHINSGAGQSQSRNHQLLSNGTVNTYPRSNRLFIQEFYLRGYAFTEPLLSS
jgi:hypothetical protein